jgi:hypothetical protein
MWPSRQADGPMAATRENGTAVVVLKTWRGLLLLSANRAATGFPARWTDTA